MLTANELKEALDYDPSTGVFTWKKKRCGRGKLGKVAGVIRPDGYMEVCVYGATYKSHRLAWLYVHGEFPAHQIDHIDGNRANNRIENLRDLPKVLNMQNQRRPQKHNTSGFLGVSWQKNRRKWEARISVSNVQHFLGVHDTAEEAYQAYLAAKRKLHDSCTI